MISVRDDLARFEVSSSGVRHLLLAEADDALMLRGSFVRGLTALSEQGLVYGLSIFPRRLAKRGDTRFTLAQICASSRPPREAVHP